MHFCCMHKYIGGFGVRWGGRRANIYLRRQIFRQISFVNSIQIRINYMRERRDWETLFLCSPRGGEVQLLSNYIWLQYSDIYYPRSVHAPCYGEIQFQATFNSIYWHRPLCVCAVCVRCVCVIHSGFGGWTIWIISMQLFDYTVHSRRWWQIYWDFFF